MLNPLTAKSLLSLVIAPCIWAVHFLACYMLVALACIYGFSGSDAGVALLTAIALPAIIYIAWLNWKEWKKIRQAHDKTASAASAIGSDHDELEIAAFFPLTSLMLCALSIVALVWVAFPAAMLPQCAS